MRAIDADSLIKNLQKAFVDNYENSEMLMSTRVYIHTIEVITNQPTIDPDKQVTSKWIKYGERRFMYFVCGNCGSHAESCVTRFCKDCGARMEFKNERDDHR